MEVDRFARYTINRNIFYVSFNLIPGQNFDGILYPSEELTKPQMNSNDWMNGKKFKKIQTKVYQKRQKHSNNRLEGQDNEQNNKTEKKIIEQENIWKNVHKENNDDNKLLNSASKNKDSKQVDNENLNKDLEKEPKSLESKITDLQNLLKIKEIEKDGLMV